MLSRSLLSWREICALASSFQLGSNFVFFFFLPFFIFFFPFSFFPFSLPPSLFLFLFFFSLLPPSQSLFYLAFLVTLGDRFPPILAWRGEAIHDLRGLRITRKGYLLPVANNTLLRTETSAIVPVPSRPWLKVFVTAP